MELSYMKVIDLNVVHYLSLSTAASPEVGKLDINFT
jgi:hypothetical protein